MIFQQFLFLWTGGEKKSIIDGLVVALAPLEQDETVLALPRARVLSVANSELFEKLREELTALDPWLVFTHSFIHLFIAFFLVFRLFFKFLYYIVYKQMKGKKKVHGWLK